MKIFLWFPSAKHRGTQIHIGEGGVLLLLGGLAWRPTAGGQGLTLCSLRLLDLRRLCSVGGTMAASLF
jgi:hypothetical protein